MFLTECCSANILRLLLSLVLDLHRHHQLRRATLTIHLEALALPGIGGSCISNDATYATNMSPCTEVVAALRVPHRGLHLVPMSLPAIAEARVQPTTGALLQLTGEAAMRTVALGAQTETILLVALGTRLTGGRRTCPRKISEQRARGSCLGVTRAFWLSCMLQRRSIIFRLIFSEACGSACPFSRVMY